MNKQILLCVETNSRARIDYQYISETIKRFYEDNRKISYKPIFLGSKTKFNDKGKLKEIEKYTKSFPGNTEVIYFIDYDDGDTSAITLDLFNRIKNFCETKGYYFVYFVKDVEDVYLGKQVSDNEKIKYLEYFKRKSLINNIKLSNLQNCLIKQHCSNILVVLDNFWKRK